MDLTVLAGLLAVIGAGAGWGAPLLAGGRRPYGVAADVLVALAIVLGLGIVEWSLIMPFFDFPGWLDLAAAVGDPLVLALIVLWIMRRTRPAVPAEE